MFAAAGLMFTSCSDDDLDNKSVIVGNNTTETPFDKWLTSNYVEPYNIQFLWRYNHNETNLQYYNIPADYNQAVELAHIVKYCCMEAYDRVAGIDFTRTYFPKMLYATGEFEYENNGTMILGTAEGGKKIFLAGTNHLDAVITGNGDNTIDASLVSDLDSRRYYLNEFFLKTIHHEFTHIMNQTKDIPTEFRQVTGSTYISDSWSTTKEDPLTHGYITAYSRSSYTEDFAEMLSTYVCNTPEQWQEWLKEAGTGVASSNSSELTGAAAIQQKLEIVRTYMKQNFNVDIDDLRTEILRREGDVLNGYVNLTDLTVK